MMQPSEAAAGLAGEAEQRSGSEGALPRKVLGVCRRQRPHGLESWRRISQLTSPPHHIITARIIISAVTGRAKSASSSVLVRPASAERLVAARVLAGRRLLDFSQ